MVASVSGLQLGSGPFNCACRGLRRSVTSGMHVLSGHVISVTGFGGIVLSLEMVPVQLSSWEQSDSQLQGTKRCACSSAHRSAY